MSESWIGFPARVFFGGEHRLTVHATIDGAHIEQIQHVVNEVADEAQHAVIEIQEYATTYRFELGPSALTELWALLRVYRRDGAAVRLRGVPRTESQFVYAPTLYNARALNGQRKHLVDTIALVLEGGSLVHEYYNLELPYFTLRRLPERIDGTLQIAHTAWLLRDGEPVEAIHPRLDGSHVPQVRRILARARDGEPGLAIEILESPHAVRIDLGPLPPQMRSPLFCGVVRERMRQVPQVPVSTFGSSGLQNVEYDHVTSLTLGSLRHDQQEEDAECILDVVCRILETGEITEDQGLRTMLPTSAVPRDMERLQQRFRDSLR